MSPAWRDPKRDYRKRPPEQPGGDKRHSERQRARSALDLPLPVFLKLLRQSPPKP